MNKLKKYNSPHVEAIYIGTPLLQAASLDGVNAITPNGTAGPDIFDDTELDPVNALSREFPWLTW